MYGWENRFDDPRRTYRTVYAAERRITAFREVLQDLQPNAKLRAEFAAIAPPRSDFLVAGTVTWEWRQKHVLAPATLELDGPLVDLDNADIRHGLEIAHASLLKQHGMTRLDMSALRSKNRIVSQTIGRTLHEDGAAGISFRSNTDDQRCYVIFEDKGKYVPEGEPEPLTDDVPELLQVCHEYDLVLRRSNLPRYVVQARLGARLLELILRVFR